MDARSHTCKSHDFIPRYDIIFLWIAAQWYLNYRKINYSRITNKHINFCLARGEQTLHVWHLHRNLLRPCHVMTCDTDIWGQRLSSNNRWNCCALVKNWSVLPNNNSIPDVSMCYVINLDMDTLLWAYVIATLRCPMWKAKCIYFSKCKILRKSMLRRVLEYTKVGYTLFQTVAWDIFYL